MKFLKFMLFLEGRHRKERYNSIRMRNQLVRLHPQFNVGTTN
jgi:hypothetical protein